MSECKNCNMHGFPCLNCAEHIYEGTLGPGFFMGNRIYLDSTPVYIRQEMQEWKTDRDVLYIMLLSILACGILFGLKYIL